MSITSFATLKAHVADVLNRSDLTAQIPVFIQSAEARLQRDDRARRLQDRELTVSADNTELPSDFYAIDSLYHNGPTYFGAVEIVGADEVGYQKGVHGQGTAGVPICVAVVNGRLRFAPVPDASYALRLTYWLKIDPLSDSNTTNWLLDAAPDIYLYATLAESAPFLKHDERLTIWEGILNRRLDELHLSTWNAQWSGPVRRRFRKIG